MSKKFTRTKGPNWTEQETLCFLELCVEKQILNLMDTKKYKHIDIFKRLVSSMTKKGFNKTPEQMKLKLKKLKQEYTRCKENNIKNGVSPTTCQFYNEIDLLYRLRSTFEAGSADFASINTAIVSELHDNTNEQDSDSSSTRIVDDTFEIVKSECDPDEETYNEKSSDCDASNSMSDLCETPEPPKRRRSNSQGRSYQTILIQYPDSFLERQQSIITKIISEQTKKQKEILESVMREQREWVNEILHNEREFQKQQMETMLQTFSQCLEKANHQPSVKQLPKIITLKQPTTFSPSAFTIQPCPMINISQAKIKPQTTSDEKTNENTETFIENEEQRNVDHK